MAQTAATACTLPYPARFEAAQSFQHSPAAGENLKKDETKLLLYALQQQAKHGPCKDPKPWAWNVVDSAKWSSWAQLGKMSCVEAMRLFVKVIEDEQPDWRPHQGWQGRADDGRVRAGPQFLAMDHPATIRDSSASSRQSHRNAAAAVAGAEGGRLQPIPPCRACSRRA
ncbi:hypothetical protein WJX84_012089 [Apatococcus fuscideae]|uniref:ACB domain-containing protein n=1 Tax=Apatococcus fuscideae TaxID=2026836 RepID=A0AAW1SWV5_9CHLO